MYACSAGRSGWTRAVTCPFSAVAGLEMRGDAGGIFLGRVRRRGRLHIPRVPVLAVVQFLGERRQPERVERVAHHRELVRLGQADRLLGQSGMRPMWEPAWVQCDGANLDA